MAPALYRIKNWLAAAVLQPAVLGAVYLLLLTYWSSQAPIVDANDHDLGAQARDVGDLVSSHFSGDIRRISVAIGCAAAVIGAVLGMLSGMLVRLRDRFSGRAPRSGLRLFKASFFVLILLHAWLVFWGMARAPQPYAPSFYEHGGFRRTIQITATDVFGSRVSFGIGIAIIALYLAGSTSSWKTIPVRVAAPIRWLSARLQARSVLVLLLGVGALAALTQIPRAHADANTKLNVVILAADSLRADRLNARTAPHLTSLGEKGTRFDRAYVSLPRTFSSWVTILTGRHPHHHGVRSMFARHEDRAVDLDALPQHLRQSGYKTAVVSDFAGDIFGRVDLGFDDVETPTFNFRELIRQRAIERQVPLLPFLDSRLGRAFFPVIREWNEAANADLLATDANHAIDRLASSPFFLTVFFSTAHFPYAAPAPYYTRFTDASYRGRFKYHKPVGLGGDDAPDADDIRQVRGLYDGAVASIDDAANRIIEHLTDTGLIDHTIIVVTADHGETLFDNGHGQGHGDHLFGDEGTHVPLIIIDPRNKPQSKNSAIVRDVDLAPTLYEQLGIVPPKNLDGRSLSPALMGKPIEPLFAYAETELWMGEVPALADAYRLPYPAVSRLTEVDVAHGYEIVLRKEASAVTTVARHRMIRDERYKLIYIPTRQGAVYQLYDTQNDAAEVNDVASDHPDIVAHLRSELWKWMLLDPKMTERNGFLVPRDLDHHAVEVTDAIRIGDDETPGGVVP